MADPVSLATPVSVSWSRPLVAALGRVGFVLAIAR
jgi:hypothetical protein